MVFDSILNPIFQPVLKLGPFWAIIILALVISLLITLVYKFFTNQSEMKRLKGQQKDFQKRLKELRSKPEEMMKVQKEAMKVNMEYMKHSFKPTLITMIPILIIFGWMAAHLTYEPIYPGEPYSITANFAEELKDKEAELIVFEGTEILSDVKQKINSGATWNLKSSEGEYSLTVKVGDEEQSKDVLITEELSYAPALENYEHSGIESIQINYNKLKPLGPNISLFGWKPGWLGLYIIFSIVFSMALRKLMGLY